MDMIRLAIAGILRDHKAGTLAKKLGDLNPSTIYKWSEDSTDNDRHSEIPLRRAIQLTLITNDTRLMDAITSEAGGVFVPGQQLVQGKFESERVALREMKASSALIEGYAGAIEDGKITAEEYKEIAKEAMNVYLATAALVESAREKAGI